jgi:hypothetical protein
MRAPGSRISMMGCLETKAEAGGLDHYTGKPSRNCRTYESTTLADKDWKEAARASQPWDHGRLHWVPARMRGQCTPCPPTPR